MTPTSNPHIDPDSAARPVVTSTVWRTCTRSSSVLATTTASASCSSPVLLEVDEGQQHLVGPGHLVERDADQLQAIGPGRGGIGGRARLHGGALVHRRRLPAHPARFPSAVSPPRRLPCRRRRRAAVGRRRGSAARRRGRPCAGWPPSGTEITAGAKLRIDVTPAATSRSATSWAACAGVAMMPIVTCASLAIDRQVVERPDREPEELGADLRRVGVDQRGDGEAPLGEPAVVGERLAEVADADDDDRPVLGEAELAAHLEQEVLDVVADAAGAVGARGTRGPCGPSRR